MSDAAIVEEFHSNGVTGSNLGDLGVGGAVKGAQVAAEVTVAGRQVVKGAGEFGGHVALGSSRLANVLPVVRRDAIKNELAEDVVG